MATREIAGKTVQVNDEGFMTNPSEWTKEIASEIAKEEGVAELSESHWKVIDYCREAGAATGASLPFAPSRPEPASPRKNCSPCSLKARRRRSRKSQGLANPKAVSRKYLQGRNGDSEWLTMNAK
jgi:hypothetical protein